MRQSFIAVFICVPACLWAQTPNSHWTGPGQSHLPKAGTMFLNIYYATDSSGALVPDSVANPDLWDDTIIVKRSGINAFGRSNCIEFETLPNPEQPRDTTYYSYAKNGDLYMRTLSRDTDWVVLPFGMEPGKVIKQTNPPSKGELFGKPYFYTNDETTQVLGYDTTSFNGKVYPCVELQKVELKVYEGVLYSNAYDYWFSPDLGFLIRANFGWDGPYFLNQQLAPYHAKK